MFLPHCCIRRTNNHFSSPVALLLMVGLFFAVEKCALWRSSILIAPCGCGRTNCPAWIYKEMPFSFTARKFECKFFYGLADSTSPRLIFCEIAVRRYIGLHCMSSSSYLSRRFRCAALPRVSREILLAYVIFDILASQTMTSRRWWWCSPSSPPAPTPLWAVHVVKFCQEIITAQSPIWTENWFPLSPFLAFSDQRFLSLMIISGS